MTDRPRQQYQDAAVLVVGGAGFIGTHLTQALLAAGARVYCAVRHPAKVEHSIAPEMEGRLSFLECDVRDRTQVQTVIETSSPQIVFNLASAPRLGNSMEEYRAQCDTTFGGVLNLVVSVMSLSEPPLLIQLGSSEEYGRGMPPFEETQPDDPISPYSLAKSTATKFLTLSSQKSGVPAIVVRPTVVYGPGQRGDMFIPYLLKHYCANQVPELTPGGQTRDFVYIDDAIAGLLAAGLHPECVGEVFNISSGEGVELKVVASAAAQLSRYSGDKGLGRKEYRPNEVMEHCASFRKASYRLDWAPRVNLGEGIKRTVTWWQQNASAPNYAKAAGTDTSD
jgi:UDP-glucose 4-epimerase